MKTNNPKVAIAAIALLLALCGCSSSPSQPKAQALSLAPNDTPAHAVSRLVGSYEQKSRDAYMGMFTGNFTYEFSTSTDPTLVQQYSAGWFRSDESASSTHLFNGYTPPGGATLPAATSITITFAVNTPTDDNSGGVDPGTHKVLATRVDGDITVPQAGTEPLTYVLTNNYNVFYFVRGDSAIGLDSSQPADAQHWYVYKWLDLSAAPTPRPNSVGTRPLTQPPTWGKLKGMYH
jgi:hypothetical protein